MKTFTPGGIHPPQSKFTSSSAIHDLPLPRRVSLSLSGHIGKPATPTVKRGDHVTRGSLVGAAAGFVSANIHTPISGTVKSVDGVVMSNGRTAPCVVIEADENDHMADLASISDATPARTVEQAMALDGSTIIDMIAAAGIVGLGGASFPTHVKLTIPEGKHADIFIANGAECEPYLTCDERIMTEQADEVAAGIELMRLASGAPRAVIGIESNKPDAISSMTRAARPYPAMSVVTLKTKYPQGGEKQLITAITGRQVPEGGLPVDAGAVVDNVATALAVYHAVCWEMPLTERVLTVTGPTCRGGNFRVPVGTQLDEIIEATGGMPENISKVILGGPMMGQCASRTDAPTLKGTSGILLLDDSLSHRGDVKPCIRCARCVDVCPMGLEPYLIATYSAKNMTDNALSLGLMSCIECGSCSYTCPSWRPLTDNIRLGKSAARRK